MAVVVAVNVITRCFLSFVKEFSWNVSVADLDLTLDNTLAISEGNPVKSKLKLPSDLVCQPVNILSKASPGRQLFTTPGQYLCQKFFKDDENNYNVVRFNTHYNMMVLIQHLLIT